MANDLVGLLEDLSGYARLGWRRAVLPLLGRGEDYLAPRYKDMVRDAVSRLHPERMRLEIAQVIDETPSTKTYRCRRMDGPIPPFRAGQYVNVFLDVDGTETSRPFSIASAPGLEHLDLTVRATPDGFVAPWIHASLGEGSELITTGPQGSFYHEPLIDGDDVVFLAGGSGITPFASIVRDQVRRGWPLKVTLVYGSRTPDDVIFGGELARLAEEHERFTYHLVISEPPEGYGGRAGLLSRELLAELIGPVGERTFYICGPNALYDLCLAGLRELGVGPHQIKRELYGPPKDPTLLPGWPKEVARDAVFRVEVEGRGEVEARAWEPLICALERAGIVVPAVCRSGECSACRTRVLSGRVFMPAEVGVRESDREAGYVHACVAYPTGDLVIRV